MNYEPKNKCIMTKEEYEIALQILNKRKITFFLKRLFDIVVSLMMIILFSPFLLILSIMILISSGKPIFFKQERMGKSGKMFNIIKFRTMKNNTATADGITKLNDNRITKVGSFLRKYRLDEFPQLFNILKGDMSFVGPRPDMPKYYKVEDYGYKYVLLVKPGVTGEATLKYKGEDTLLALSNDPEKTYTEVIFPEKIRLNIEYIKNINFLYDINIMFRTFSSVFLHREDKTPEVSINSEAGVHL